MNFRRWLFSQKQADGHYAIRGKMFDLQKGVEKVVFQRNTLGKSHIYTLCHNSQMIKQDMLSIQRLAYEVPYGDHIGKLL